MTNSLSFPTTHPHTHTLTLSFISLVAHLPPPPQFPLSHFISLHLCLQFPFASSLNRTVCPFNSPLSLSHPLLNLLSTAVAESICQEIFCGVYFQQKMKLYEYMKRKHFSYIMYLYGACLYLYRSVWGMTSSNGTQRQMRWRRKTWIWGSSFYSIFDQSLERITMEEKKQKPTTTTTNSNNNKRAI